MKGMQGKVVYAWEKCEVDPTCCCAELSMEDASVQVRACAYECVCVHTCEKAGRRGGGRESEQASERARERERERERERQRDLLSAQVGKTRFVCVHIYRNTHTHTRTRTHTHTHTQTHTHTHTHTHTQTHTYIYVHIHVNNTSHRACVRKYNVPRAHHMCIYRV